MILQFPTARVFESMYRADVRYVALTGGRGSGKSHQAAQFALTLLCQMAHFGGKMVCIRETQKSLRFSSKELLAQKISKYRLPGFVVMRDEIRTPGGGVITFVGMQNHNAESIKSLEGFDLALIEEARSLSARSIELLRPTLRKPGCKLIFVWNPESPNDAVEELFSDPSALPGGGLVIRANYYDNPFLDESMLEEAVYDQIKRPSLYNHIWLGAYRNNDDYAIFKNWRIDDIPGPAIVGANIMQNSSAHWWNQPDYHFGADFGFSVDPSALIRSWTASKAVHDGIEYYKADQNGRLLIIDKEAWGLGVKTDHLPAFWAGDSERWVNPMRYPGIPLADQCQIVADSARPDTIDFLAQRGFNVTPSPKGPSSVQEDLDFLAGYFQEIVVDAECRHTIDELTHYSIDLDPKTGKPKFPARPADVKNHLIDGLRYGWQATRMAGLHIGR